MCLYRRIDETGQPLPPPHVLLRFEVLEECILSGQLSDAEIVDLLHEEPGFARWFKTRVPDRGCGCVAPVL